MAETGGSTEDALRRLEERLGRASEAAERMITEAASAAKPPPAGWQAPQEDHVGSERPRDVELLMQLVHSLGELIPPELQRRLAEALRELLLALRALLDWYIERLERRRAEPATVQDIPIV